MKSLNTDNKGFSLVEVLVSMALLAIIIIPILNNFLAAAKVNQKARNTQDVTTLAQNVLEGMEGKESLKTIAQQFNEPDLTGSEFDILSRATVTKGISELRKDSYTAGYQSIANLDERTYVYPTPDPYGVTPEEIFREKENTQEDNKAIYYFGMAGVQEGNALYDILVTMDGWTNYRTVTAASPIPRTNDFEMPVISSISGEGNALISQTYQDNWAKDTLYGNYTGYAAQYLATNPLATPMPILTPDQLEETMSREINVTINYNTVSSEYSVSCQYEYSTPYIPASPVLNLNKVTYDIYDKKIGTELNQIYLFFDPILRSTTSKPYDKINIINNIGPQEKAAVNVMLIEQSSVKEADPTAYVNQLPSYRLRYYLKEGAFSRRCTTSSTNISNTNIIYSGAALGSSSSAVIEHENDTRIYDVKVEIFRAKLNETDRYQPTDLVATFTTTKGE